MYSNMYIRTSLKYTGTSHKTTDYVFINISCVNRLTQEINKINTHRQPCTLKCGLHTIYKQLLFRLQPLRFGIAERGKFDNISYTPLAVAKQKVNSLSMKFEE